MTFRSAAEVTQIAKQAGFKGQGLAIAVAVAHAESNFNDHAYNPELAAGTPEGSGSRGLWQIYGKAHPQYNSDVTYQPSINAKAAYEISYGGNNWTAWSTFNSGAYKQFLGDSGAGGLVYTDGGGNGILAGIINATTPWNVAKAHTLWPWLCDAQGNLRTNNQWNSTYESSRGGTQDGIGIADAYGESLTSLTAGTVMLAAYGTDYNPAWQYGGFILVQSTLPLNLGTVDVFYRHTDENSVVTGDVVKVGQVLGVTGGQTSGGKHPCMPISSTGGFSSGPHIDIGVNPQTLPGPRSGINVDPTPWLKLLISNGPSVSDLAAGTVSGIPGVGDQAAKTVGFIQGSGIVNNTYANICANLDYTSQSFQWPDGGNIGNLWYVPQYLQQNFEQWSLRSIIFTLGFCLLLIVVFNMLRPAAESASGAVSAVAPLAAAAML